MVAGNPVSVQSPARNRFFQAVTGPGRRAFCSGVASNVARRSRTICQGGKLALHAGRLADVPPDRLRQLLARHIDQPVAIADGDRQPLRERKQPLHQAADDAEIGGASLGRIEAEMRVDDGAEFRRRLQPGSSDAAGRGGTAITTASSGPSATLSSPNFNSPTLSPASRIRAVRGRTGSSRPCPAAA